MKRFTRVVVLAVMLALMAPQMTSATPLAKSPKSLALYNGRIIDLSVSWEGAKACRIGEVANFCYDSEQEMDRAIVQGLVSSPLSILSDCGTDLKLYDGTSYGGAVVALSQRLTWISLSGYGFSAITSSYKVGSCNSSFRDASLITYPGSTGAGASATSMVAGWNNRVTSVFIS